MRRSKIASFSLPPVTWKRTDELARAAKRSRSEIVAEAIETYYTMQQWDELRRIGARRAVALGIRDEDDVERLIQDYRRRRR